MVEEIAATACGFAADVTWRSRSLAAGGGGGGGGGGGVQLARSRNALNDNE